MRKWGFVKLDGLHEGDKPSAIIGTEVHRLAEVYHVTTVLPDITIPLTVPGWKKGAPPRTVYPGKIFMKGLHLLPKPQTMKPERKFTVTIGGHKFRGSIDLYYGALNPSRIIDYKTFGNAAYIKTPEYLLRRDPQSSVYSSFGISEGASRVELEWIYFPTKEGRARSTELKLTKADVLGMQGRIVESADRMARARDDYKAGKLTVLDLPPTPSACSAFGGCAFVDRCNLTAAQKISALYRKGNDMSSLREMLAKKNAEQSGGSGGSTASDTKNETKSNKASDDHDDQWSGMDRDDLKAEAIKRGLCDKSSKLGDESLRNLLRNSKPASGTDTGSSDSNDEESYDDMELGDLQKEAIKRGMHTADAVASVKRSKLISELREWDANPPKVQTTTKQTRTADPSDGENARCVYIGCIPVGEKITNAVEIIDAANELVCKEEGVAHYTQVPGFPPATLARALREILPNYSGNIVLERSTLGPIVDEFIRDAYMVVRGT